MHQHHPESLLEHMLLSRSPRVSDSVHLGGKRDCSSNKFSDDAHAVVPKSKFKSHCLKANMEHKSKNKYVQTVVYVLKILAVLSSVKLTTE